MKPYHHLLNLSGYGYLHSIVQQADKNMARMKAVTHFNPSNQGHDDVWIDCEINARDHLTRLNDLLHLVRAGDLVLVTFQAEYSVFVNAYSGQLLDDPNHMVTLQSKLQMLGDCYVNGCLVKQASLCAVA